MIYVVVQKPGKGLELLFIISTNGMIRYRNPAVSDRMTVSYDSSRRMGTITINWVQPEDTGDYYVAIGNADYPMYWSQGTRLTVTTASQYKTAPRKVSSSKQK